MKKIHNNATNWICKQPKQRQVTWRNSKDHDETDFEVGHK